MEGYLGMMGRAVCSSVSSASGKNCWSAEQMQGLLTIRVSGWGSMAQEFFVLMTLQSIHLIAKQTVFTTVWKKITFLPQGNLSSILKTNTFFGDNISLCSQGWHLALDPPASAFQMPGLQVCTTTSSELLEDKVLSCFSASDHGTQAVPQTCQQVEDGINTTYLPLQIPGPPLLPTFMDHTECHMVGQVGITICLYKPTFHHLNCC